MDLDIWLCPYHPVDMRHSCCTPLSWSQAQPGDLVVYPEDAHAGIAGGWDESENIQIIHCATGQSNVAVTGQAGFPP